MRNYYFEHNAVFEVSRALNSIIVRVEAKRSASTANVAFPAGAFKLVLKAPAGEATANGEWNRNVSLPRPQYIHYLFYFHFFFLFYDLHVFILCPQISMEFSRAIRFGHLNKVSIYQRNKKRDFSLPTRH